MRSLVVRFSRFVFDVFFFFKCFFLDVGTKNQVK